MKNKSTLSFGIAIGIVVGAVSATLVVNKLKDNLDHDVVVSVGEETKVDTVLNSKDIITVSLSDSHEIDPATDLAVATEKVRHDIQQARNLLKTETLEWSKKLPEAKTLEEEYFHLYLQIAYEKKDVDILTLASKNLSLFKNVKNDKEFKNYITACLESDEIEKEKKVRDFVIHYTKLIY